MKILFIYTDINTMGQGEMTYHSGLCMLSAVLKQKGHMTDIFCMYDRFKPKGLLKKINQYKPDVIVITSDTTQFPYVKKIVERIKSRNIFTVLGGVHASLLPECLEEVEGLNAICIGEGEHSLLELVESLDNGRNYHNIDSLWFKTKEGLVKNRIRPFIQDLDSLPFSDRELFDYQKIIDSDCGRLSFMLSRGCPYNCTYCASPSMGRLQEGRYVRFMSVKRAIEELEYLKGKYKFKTVFFADDTFTINKNYVKDFCFQYKQRIKIPFEVNTRVESSSPEVFKYLKNSGCFKVHMGIESGHQEFRKNMLNRNMTDEQIVAAFSWAKQSGLLTKSYNIVGFPYETPQIHEATVDLNREINPDSHVCYIFQPYPGTKLYEVCKKNGFINEDLIKKQGVSRRIATLKMKRFTPQQIQKAHRNFSFKIYKNTSLKKAIIYKLYYSMYGEILLRIFRPFKNFLRRVILK